MTILKTNYNRDLGRSGYDKKQLTYGTAGEPRFKTEIGEEKLNYVADRAFLGSKDLISLLNSLHGA